MTAKFFALLTNQGAAKLANATALGTQLSLTQMAVGDGGGVLPTPDPAQTKLIDEKRRASLNSLSVDPANTNQIIAEQIIPEDQGGFWIREIGLFDQDNTLIAIANCPETYKPQLQEGSGRTQTVRLIIVVNSTDAVTLKIDPAVVLATRKYVDDKVIEVKAYTDDQLAKHVAVANPHNQYLQIGKSLAEIKALGPEAVSAVLANLGLGTAAQRAVGTGTNQIPDISSFSAGTVNAFKIPTGHIVQFGAGQTTSGGFTQSYPIPFPSICQVLLGVVYSTLGVRAFIATNTSDRTAANMNVVDTSGNGINVTVGYIAIGH